MTIRDPIADVALLLHPDPLFDDYDSDQERDDAQLAAEHARDALIEELRQRADITDDDVLLHLIARQQEIRMRTDENVRVLVAYLRNQIRPRPYTLSEIGEALNLPTSSVAAMVKPRHEQIVNDRLDLAAARP